jgi:hypothetical protein
MTLNDQMHLLIPTFLNINKVFHKDLFNLRTLVYIVSRDFFFFLPVRKIKWLFLSLYQQCFLLHIIFLQSIQYHLVIALIF